MNFFVRNVLWLHLFALVLAFSWIHGGTRPDLLLPVIPWLAAFVLEMVIVFPQAKRSETLAEARSRVWLGLKRDPLVYAALVLTVLLVIPMFNVAGSPVYDAAGGKWTNPRPPFSGLPSCVNPNEHAVLLLWFPPVLIAALAAKHGLLMKGKRMLLEGLCWNGAGLALLGFLQMSTGAKSIYWGAEPFSHFFSTFGYPNFAGAFFTLLFAVSTGLWFGRASENVIGLSVGGDGSADEKSVWQRHGLLLAVLLNLAAAVASLSRAAILLCAVVLVVLVLYIIFGVWQRVERGGHVQILMAVAVLAFVGTLALTVFAPQALKKELASITPTAVMDRVTGRGYYHARVAKEIFRDHPTFGVGGWGYPHYVMQYLTPEEIKANKVQMQGGANVHNDALQFLAEQGWVGYGMLVICALLLIVPLPVQAVSLLLFFKSKEQDALHTPPKPEWLYRLPPPLVAVFIGATATVVHSFGDLPFRDPAVLIVWVLAFACAPGFIPVVRKS